MRTQFRLQFIVLLWGFTGVMGKLISFDALPLVFWRMLIASIVIFLLLKVTKITLKVTRKQLLQYLGVGAVIGFHWWAFFAAIKASNVSVALSTLAMGSLFTAFIEPIFFKRKINAYEILLSLVVVICLWLIFRASPEYVEGILLGILCTFLSAVFSVLNAVLQKNPDNRPRKMMFYEMMGGFVVITAVLILNGQIEMVGQLKAEDGLWLFILGALLTAYPMIESVELMKQISPYTLLLSVNLEPVYGIILAYFIFGESEKMSPVFYFATGLMIAVLIVNGLMKRKKVSTTKSSA